MGYLDQVSYRGIGDRYNLLKAAYFGTGGFSTGEYLTRHKRETDADYLQRQINAYYLNYFAPIINALVDPIFKRQPLRDYSGPASALIKEFSEDVDCNGTDIDDFMKRAAVMAKIYGVSFIVIDNITNPNDVAGTRAAMLEKRAIPYAYCVEPGDVDDFGLDTTGQLSYIKFHDVASVSEGKQAYRYTEFSKTGWRIYGEGSAESSGTYNLGCVPVVPLFSRLLEQKTILPAPELLPIAKTAKALYNHCSWLGEILRGQTFPILTIPSTSATDIVIGNNNALGYESDSSHAPDFIAPPSDPAKVLQDQIKLLIQEMYRMASLSFMTTTADTTSGVARQWEFERTNQQLANFAGQCRSSEIRLMDIFSKWVNEKIDYNVTYPLDFGVVDTAAEIQEAQAVLDLGLTDGLREEVLKKVLAAYCPDLPDDRFDEIMAGMEQDGIDQKNAEPSASPPDAGQDGAGNGSEDTQGDD